MKFSKKLLKAISMMVLSCSLILGGAFSPMTVSAECKDLGTYTVDLSKGRHTLKSDEYMTVIINIAANEEKGRVKADYKEKSSIVKFDINCDGVNDVELDFNNGPEGTSGVFGKCDSCTMTGTYELNCKDYEIPSSSTQKVFYSTVIFKFTEDAPAVNSETNTTQDAAVAPVKEEKLDPSIKVPTLNKLQKTKKSVKVSWKKLNKKALKNIDGFEIQCSTDKSFATIDKQTIAKKNKTSVSIKKLTPGKKYFVRVRAFKKVNGEKVYSNWSKLKNAKLPKK